MLEDRCQNDDVKITPPQRILKIAFVNRNEIDLSIISVEIFCIVKWKPWNIGEDPMAIQMREEFNIAGVEGRERATIFQNACARGYPVPKLQALYRMQCQVPYAVQRGVDLTGVLPVREVSRRITPFERRDMLLTFSIVVKQQEKIENAPEGPPVQHVRPIARKIVKPPMDDPAHDQELVDPKPHQYSCEAKPDDISESRPLDALGFESQVIQTAVTPGYVYPHVIEVIASLQMKRRHLLPWDVHPSTALRKSLSGYPRMRGTVDPLSSRNSEWRRGVCTMLPCTN